MAIFWKALCSLLPGLLWASSASGWSLQAQPVATQTWVVQGVAAEFSADNRGHIANATFIATGRGVILVDSGSTLAFGQALRALIARTTDQPVRWILHTHHHPDHVLGSHAFPEARVLALAGTDAALARDGDAFLDTLQERLGPLTRGTRVRMADHPVVAGAMELDGYGLELLALRGHSGADLAVWDPRTRVLMAGDLLFWQRAPTTPHSPGLETWLQDLRTLEALPARVIVPGHGPVARDPTPIRQTRAWLEWLDQLLSQGVAEGLTINELLQAPMPPELAQWPLARFELTRSLTHLYRHYEQRLLEPPTP